MVPWWWIVVGFAAGVLAGRYGPAGLVPLAKLALGKLGYVKKEPPDAGTG